MKQIIKDFLFSLINLVTPGTNTGAVILMYHSVGDNKALFTVKSDIFERQIYFLKNNGFTFLKVSELVERLNSGGSLKNVIVVTLDDGYEDNYTNALPILKKYSIPATVFVSTGYIGKTMTTSDGVILPILNESMIAELVKTGLVECMPHGHMHDKLAKLKSEEVRNDVVQSREIIERITGNKADYFAYPYGNYSDEVIEIVSSLGFKGAVSVKEDIVTNQSNLFILPRMTLDSGTSFQEFACKVKRTSAYLGLKRLMKS